MTSPHNLSALPSLVTAATVVTGFLGSGKTTLISNLLSTTDKRLGLIINEFGKLGVDKEIIACEDGCKTPLIELSNGCICCTVSDEFIPAMENLLNLKEPVDHIIIETSGLALPKPLIKAFNWEELRTRLTFDGVVCVIDGRAFADGAYNVPENPAHENPLQEVFADQLAVADLTVLNKLDLITQTEQKKLIAEIKKLNPRTKVITTTYGKIPDSVLLGINAKVENDLLSRQCFHDNLEHDHDDFETFIVEPANIGDMAQFTKELGKIIAAHDILRIKGFIDCKKPMRMRLQAVGNRITCNFDRPWNKNEERVSRLVVIGRKGVNSQAIALALNA